MHYYKMKQFLSLSFLMLLDLAKYGAIPVDHNGVMFDKKKFSGNGETPRYWRNKAKDDLNKCINQQNNIGVARNIILFLGDGMGISTITAARIFQGQLQNQSGEENILSWERFDQVALTKTYSQDHQTPDSAATATAFLCGVKTNSGILGVDASVRKGDCSSMKGAELTSIADWSLAKGKSVGFVTTTRVTHATPASLYAHTPHRNWEGDADMDGVVGGCKDIASQLIDDNRDIKVIMGGGRRYFIPSDEEDPERGTNTKYGRRDGRNLIKEWIKDKENRGYNSTYVWNSTDFQNIDLQSTDYILGLFEDSHMHYEVDRLDKTKEIAGEPSLAEMTETAIRLLQKDTNGYFLLVEGGRIDHAHHESNAFRSLYDTIAFADAVEIATEITNTSDTLIVVTSDHSHTLTLGGYPSRGNPILGLTDNDDQTSLALDNKTYTTLLYANGPGDTDRRLNTTADTAEAKPYVQESVVPLTFETHSGEDVAIYARGPMSHLFQGVHEQNYIPFVMAFASCVGDFENNEHCAASLIKGSNSSTLQNYPNASNIVEPSICLLILYILSLMFAYNRHFMA